MQVQFPELWSEGATTGLQSPDLPVLPVRARFRVTYRAHMRPQLTRDTTIGQRCRRWAKTGLMSLALLFSGQAAVAQTYNFNVGGGFTMPQGDTSVFTNVDGNFEIGGGVNIFRFLGIQGEYMWNGLRLKDSIVRRATIADAHSRLHSLTGNLIFRLYTGERGWGVYLIGGGGWYRRSWNITLPEDTVAVACDPVWSWLGTLTCVGGVVPDNEIIAEGHTDAPGWNFGGGVTRRLGEGPAQFYAEARYHRANHDRFKTEVLPITFGFRF
jgi:hypothetical protein